MLPVTEFTRLFPKDRHVNSEPNNGPIIEQEVILISHRDSVEDLIRKGRDLEKVFYSVHAACWRAPTPANKIAATDVPIRA